MQAVKWAGDVVDNEHLNKRSSKSESTALGHPHAASHVCHAPSPFLHPALLSIQAMLHPELKDPQEHSHGV